jgi:D-3-phosphoglycerate dehydrogenase
VNCARGSLLDYDALTDTLRSGHFFAGADVFPQGPIPRDSSLVSLRNFVMTPHIAGGTCQAAEKAAAIAAEEVARCVSRQPLRFRANPETITKAATT